MRKNAYQFAGADYVPGRDGWRLRKQLDRVWAAMADGEWRTLGEIAELTGDPESSISAQLRNLRKPIFGANVIERRHRGWPGHGLYEYALKAR